MDRSNLKNDAENQVFQVGGEPKHGGKRPGSGRKPLTEAEKISSAVKKARADVAGRHKKRERRVVKAAVEAIGDAQDSEIIKRQEQEREASEQLVRAVMDRIADGPKVKPLELMLASMETLLSVGNLAGALEIAEKAAPYVHPKLSTANIRQTIPLEELSDDELEGLERLSQRLRARGIRSRATDAQVAEGDGPGDAGGEPRALPEPQ